MIRLYSTLISICIAVCGWMLAKYFKILDKPGRDIAARKPVPTIQGIFLTIAIIVSVWILGPSVMSHHLVRPFVLGCTLIMLLFAVDEGLSLYQTNKQQLPHLIDVIPSWIKLVLQLAIIGGVIAVTGFYEWNIVWGGINYTLPIVIGTILAFGRFLLFINAINRFDYAYGQASGLSFVGFVAIIILVAAIVLPHYTGISTDHYETLGLVISLAGVCAMVSLIYTVMEYQPLGLVRDAGVMVYGFALAYLSLMGGAKIGTIMVALSLPLFDAIWVICHRIFVMRKNPLKGDYTHLHHRLLTLGRSRTELRWFIRLRSLVMMILILLQGTNRINKIIIFGLFAVIYFGINAYLFRYKKMPLTTIQADKGT